MKPVRTLTRAWARQPKDAGILINLGNALMDIGRFEEAEARLAEAQRLTPGDPRVLYNQALLSLVQGRFTVAWPGRDERFRAGATRPRGLMQPCGEVRRCKGKPCWSTSSKDSGTPSSSAGIRSRPTARCTGGADQGSHGLSPAGRTRPGSADLGEALPPST